MSNAMTNLQQYAHTLTDLRHTLELLHWDQETYLPPDAHTERGDQIATLTGIIHEYATSEKLKTLLAEAQLALAEDSSINDIDRGLVRVMQRDFNQATKLPAAFVKEFSETTSKALAVWVNAKKQNDVSLFAPTLEKIVDLCRKQADYLGYTDSPYDALLNLYEEGLTTREVTRIFSELKEKLVPLISVISQKWNHPLLITKDIPQHLQKQLADEALSWIGYSIQSGRQDISAHPFTITLGHHDRRVTNRYNPRQLDCIFSALHEGGHGLYEQGISEALTRTPLDTGVSLGIHESQSRLWENLVGRSKLFWQKHFPRVKELIGEYLNVQTVDEWYAAINEVKPSLIRVEADEVTYCLHIIIRFELEKDLIEGKLAVKDVKEAWNAKYKEYLGVEVTDDAHGVLQDIHWSYGNHGYFPTYALGTLASIQIREACLKSNQDIAAALSNGETSQLLIWLQQNVYAHGAIYPPSELLQRITGTGYDATAFINYLQQKYLNS